MSVTDGKIILLQRVVISIIQQPFKIHFILKGGYKQGYYMNSQWLSRKWDLPSILGSYLSSPDWVYRRVTKTLRWGQLPSSNFIIGKSNTQTNVPSVSKYCVNVHPSYKILASKTIASILKRLDTYFYIKIENYFHWTYLKGLRGDARNST